MDDRLVVSLLRHGLTLENEQKAYIGWLDSPLSELGKQQLIKMSFSVPRAELIFSSPLLRCLETAHIFFPKSQIITIEELKEMYFGAWEGKTYEELKHNDMYRKWLTDIFTEPIEAGESFIQFSKRISTGVEQIFLHVKEKHVNHIAVVTHGGVIRFILHKLFSQEKSFFDWQIPYGGGYELTFDKNQLEEANESCILSVVEPITVKQIG